jgi:inosine/xanthosine triphosphatase
MIIAVGTTNIIKIQAVEEVIKNYPQLATANVYSFSVPSEIAEQPLSLEEIILGAKNRARNAYAACTSCNYSFGIESGLLEASGTQTGFLEACICCIYDGNDYHIGLSCGFEIPPHILALVLDKNRDLSQACYESGITTNAKLGAAEGLIGILTKGRINRKEYTKQCVITALIQLENALWYQEAKIEQYDHNWSLDKI